MSLEEEHLWRCPLCHQLTGRAERFAANEGEQIRVIVRCTDCRHRWSVIRSAAGPDRAPKRPT